MHLAPSSYRMPKRTGYGMSVPTIELDFEDFLSGVFEDSGACVYRELRERAEQAGKFKLILYIQHRAWRELYIVV